MRDRPNENPGNGLPPCANDFIRQLTKKMRYRRKVRQDVQAELTAHFEDELQDVTDPAEREKRAKRLIEEFGDVELLAVLCQRAKKRCRPLWVRAWVRMMQAVGVFLLVFIPYTIWFISGKPNPTTGYLAKVNALRRPDGPIKDNAWWLYKRAMELVVEPNQAVQQASWFKYLKPPKKPLTLQERKVVEDWIAVNPLAWQIFESATARRQCQRVYQRVPGKRLLWDSMEDPPLVRLKRLVQIGLWKSRLVMEQGQTGDALGHCVTILRAGAHWQTNAFLIEQLVGQSISQEACREILRIVAAAHVSDDQLLDLQNRLLQVYEEGYPFTNFDAERLWMREAVQYCFTNGGPGGGHRVVASYVADLMAAPQLVDQNSLPMPRVITGPMGLGLSMFHASRNKTLAKIDQIHKHLRQIAGLSPYERRIRRIADLGETAGATEKWRYALVYILLPAERKVSELAFRAKAEYEALVTVVALKRYRLQQDGYPPDLEPLLRDKYLDKLPMDPYSDAPLVYKPTNDGFTLYSVGPDFTDDTGQPGPERYEDGRPKVWADKGDVVFWPVGP